MGKWRRPELARPVHRDRGRWERRDHRVPRESEAQTPLGIRREASSVRLRRRESSEGREGNSSTRPLLFVKETSCLTPWHCFRKAAPSPIAQRVAKSNTAPPLIPSEVLSI